MSILNLSENRLRTLPASAIGNLNITVLDLGNNPLNPEIAAAYKQGIEVIKAYLRAKADGRDISLNEAKLLLVGDGGVGKTTLLAALRDEKFVENQPTTHGIEVEIKSLTVNPEDSNVENEITLNSWDFGGQNIYLYTHQIFFTAPAVYLVVWDPTTASLTY